ncbi:nucleoside hydrolase [Trametopsis cervina]|nr:nucleoside hydrolase [Trametopsis cervina]
MSPQTSQRRIPVIIDTDPGVDDILAILLALASPEIDIKAIIVTFGNTDVDAAYLNILRLYNVLLRQSQSAQGAGKRFPSFSQRTPIILAKGADQPLKGDQHSAQYFHGRDGLGNISKRHPDFAVESNIDPAAYPDLAFSSKTGIEVALDVINSEPERTITYIALGPLTTLAQLSHQYEEVLRNRLGQVACMGGALDVPGNTSPVAEFNFFADPYAVRALLNPEDPNKGIPLDRFILLPLDITTPHELPFPFYVEHVDKDFTDTKNPSLPTLKSPLVHFTSSFLERTREVMLSFGKDAMELHDIVAVWYALENPPSPTSSGINSLTDGWKAVMRHFQVERVGEITRGMLVVDRRDDEGAYDPGANRAAVQAVLEKNTFHSAGILESTAVPAQVEVETAPSVSSEADRHGLGVPVVVKTPGPAALLKILSERVWGVSF